MPSRRVTLADVARAAGVSSTTASFVLNDRSNAIPAATRQRVLDAARRSGYRPHAAARALATGRPSPRSGSRCARWVSWALMH